MKKPRPEAVLLNLPEAQEEALASWLLAGLPYHLAQKRLETDFGVVVKSLSSFTRFYTERCAPRLQARLQMAMKTADKIYKDAKRNPEAINAATAVLLRTRAFEILQNPSANPKDVAGLVKLLISAKKQELDRQNLALDKEKFILIRRKAERLDELESKAKQLRADGGVSPETLDVLEKQLRLM